MQRLSRFLLELKRRKVFHVASIYVVTAWGASLGASELFPPFGIPEWAVRLFVIAAILGFPIAMVLAWAFEITPGGVVLDQGVEEPPKGKSAPSVPSSATTTWLAGQNVQVRWRDDVGDHSKEFGQGFVMGRDQVAEVRIDDPKVSRLHARVSYEKGRWWIVDMSSRNGTRVDGALINERTPVNELVNVTLYDGGPAIELTVDSVSDETVTDIVDPT